MLTAFGNSCTFRQDLGGACGCPRNFGWRLRISAKSAGPTDGLNKPSGCGMETLKDFDGFCGFRRSPADLGGILRNPSVFRWVCADACPTSVRGILIFKWSGCLTICELCRVPTSCPVYCLALPPPVSPPPQISTSKICKLLPVVTSNVAKKQRHQIRKQGFPKTGLSCS